MASIMKSMARTSRRLEVRSIAASSPARLCPELPRDQPPTAPRAAPRSRAHSGAESGETPDVARGPESAPRSPSAPSPPGHHPQRPQRQHRPRQRRTERSADPDTETAAAERQRRPRDGQYPLWNAVAEHAKRQIERRPHEPRVRRAQRRGQRDPHRDRGEGSARREERARRFQVLAINRRSAVARSRPAPRGARGARRRSASRARRPP